MEINKVHHSSQKNFRLALQDFFFCDASFWDKKKPRVLEVGSQDINGSISKLFPSSLCFWVGADIQDGPNVTVVMEDPTKLPFPDKEFDLVYSLQTFEHAPHFWKVFQEMCRVCNNDGVIIVIAPSEGAEHRHPVDCYRFLPDSFFSLAKDNGMIASHVWRDKTGPFYDLVGVFHHAEHQCRIRIELKKEFKDMLCDWGTHLTDSWIDPDTEARKGEIPYLDFLATAHELLQPRGYTEIGVWTGESLRLAKSKSIAIDPFLRLQSEMNKNVAFFEMVSDEFFFKYNLSAELEHLDLAYIDGLHRVEFALKDFMNLEAHSNPYTVILVDDIFPNHPTQAARVRKSTHWTGDVWKLVHILKHHRPDLHLLLVDTEPTGTLVIWGCNKNNLRLWEIYDFLMAHESEDFNPSNEILLRSNSISPSDPILRYTFEEIRKARNGSLSISKLNTVVNESFPRRLA